MDTTSLYYFLELSKDLHMTRTAERLFISQQTLSNHILRLEKQFGCRLFYRKPSLMLTYAGEQVQNYASRILRAETSLMDVLADVEKQRRGTIRFGASTLRMNACLPTILPRFSEEYPFVEIQITDQTSKKLEPMILNGELDFALVAGGGISKFMPSVTDRKHIPSNKDAYADGKKKKEPELIREHILSDPVYFCAMDSVLDKYLGSRKASILESTRNGTDLKDFRDLPFMLFENLFGQIVDRCFEEADIIPHTYIKAPYTQIITRIGLEGTAAFFSTGVVLSSQQETVSPDLHVIPVLYKGRPVYMNIYLIRDKERYIPQYAARFLELLRECFHSIEENTSEMTDMA